jgi:prepilin-type N-terminal cleavage/methylation domain-containing protein
MKRSKVFTLVELLVVIAIISILIAMLAPTIGRARETARQTQCKSNIRGVGQGLLIYANNSRDLFPRFDNEWGIALLLARNYTSDGKVFACPSAANPVYDSIEKLTNLQKEVVQPDGSTGAMKDPGYSEVSLYSALTGDAASAGNLATKGFPYPGYDGSASPGPLGFACTSANNAANSGEWLATGQLGYLYAGGDSVASTGSTTPMMRDMDKNHGAFDFGSVLMGDGSVQAMEGANWWNPDVNAGGHRRIQTNQSTTGARVALGNNGDNYGAHWCPPRN